MPSDEVEDIVAEAETITAACALSAPGATLPGMPTLMPATSSDDACIDVSDDGDGEAPAETRRERKALAAKAARKRARERLASLEHQVAALTAWLGELRSLTACGRSGRDASPAADDSSDDASRTSCDSYAKPPKKRHRAEPRVLEVPDLE